MHPDNQTGIATVTALAKCSVTIRFSKNGVLLRSLLSVEKRLNLGVVLIPSLGVLWMPRLDLFRYLRERRQRRLPRRVRLPLEFVYVLGAWHGQ